MFSPPLHVCTNPTRQFIAWGVCYDPAYCVFFRLILFLAPWCSWLVHTGSWLIFAWSCKQLYLCTIIFRVLHFYTGHREVIVSRTPVQWLCFGAMPTQHRPECPPGWRCFYFQSCANRRKTSVYVPDDIALTSRSPLKRVAVALWAIWSEGDLSIYPS